MQPPSRRQLRTCLRRHRRQLSARERIAAAESLADRLLALPYMPANGNVAGYWAQDGEIALHAWQLRLPPGLHYCLPVLHDAGLRFARWRPGQPLRGNRFGIPEPEVDTSDLLNPEHMQMVVLPLTGFDDAGGRLGMGGGYYDRSFAFRQSSPAPPWLVGVGFSFQRMPKVPQASWDIRLDAVCTENDTLLCTGPLT